MVIEIPADVVEREAQSVTAQYARVARVPGFRPGHAPPSLIWRLFRKDIRSEVVQARPAEKSDYLIVNYRGRDAKDPAASPVEARDALVHLGGKGTVGAFTENLDRTRPGDVREFEVAYPEDYPQKSLAGKTLHYRVEVQSIKKKVVPALDDELAKSVSEFSKLEELRVKLREDLKERRKRAVGGAAKQKLVEQLLQAHPIPVPKVVVERQ